MKKLLDFLHKSKMVEGFLGETKVATCAHMNVREERRQVSLIKLPARLIYAGSLICLVTILLIVGIAKADLPNIVALVNNEPITLNEFRARKQMIIALNNIQNPDSNQNKQLDKAAIKSLIDESLLYQHEKGKQISEEEINNAIRNIEERNKMPEGHLLKFLKSKSVDINSFKSQVKSELIKMNILSNMSRSVVVSPKEIDAIILTTNSKDAEISAQIFTSKDKSDKTLSKMYNLQKRLKNCQNIKDSLYANFATVEIVNENLSKLDSTLQTVIKDLNINQASTVFETKDGFKLILVCNKKIINISTDENNYVVNFLTNKKMSQKAQKFFEDMHKKAYIKVMLPL